MPGVQNPHCTPPAREEGVLQRSELAPGGKPLDRGDLTAVGLQREVAARVDRLAVDQHHAGTALGVVAAFLAPGQPELAAQGREQRSVGLHGDADRPCR